MSASTRVTGTERNRHAWVLQCARGNPRFADRSRLAKEHREPLEVLRRLAPRIAPGEAQRARESYEELCARGFEVVSLFDRNYPRLLRAIPDPPIALSMDGNLTPDDHLCVAIVGSRRASEYGLDVARRLAFQLARRGLTIVSGMARGIDRAAHEGALEARTGRTIAVLGSGLAQLYPREHAGLAAGIAARGALLSEFDIHEPPHARNFPRRNRIVTGLCLGTIVVEAAAKSGSLISARHALEQDREVFAVPGPIDSKGSEGVHALLRDGATLVSSSDDVIDELAPPIRELLRDPDSTNPMDAAGEDVVAAGPDEKRVLGLLEDRESMAIDMILDRSGLSTERTLAALARLELDGRVRSLPGGRFRKKR